MKILLIILFSLTEVLLAAELRLRDGTVLRNSIIISANPESMLVVHDGGGFQLEYTKLEPNSLNASQREIIETRIREYVERTARIEKLQLEQQEFEQAQREKGLIFFEDAWMKPMEREAILVNRERRQLEREKELVALEQEKTALKKQQQRIAEGDRLLESDSGTYISITTRRSSGYWYGSGYPVCIFPYSVNRTGRSHAGCFRGSPRP